VQSELPLICTVHNLLEEAACDVVAARSGRGDRAIDQRQKDERESMSECGSR
jgi:hypothetical protein